MRDALGSSSIIQNWYIVYGLEILHKCGKKFETISQKMLGSDPYICRSYSGKTGRGSFCWGSEFIKGEIYLIGEFSLGEIFVIIYKENKEILSLSFGKFDYVIIFVRERFHLGKFSSPSQNFATFLQRSFPG